MVDIVEEKKVLLIEIFGSRNDHSFIDVVTCYFLSFHLARQSKGNIVLGPSNTQSCCNRIVHSFTSLTAQADSVQ